MQGIRERRDRLRDPVGRPTDTFSGVDVLGLTWDGNPSMSAYGAGQAQLGWLDQLIPSLQAGAAANLVMRMFGYNERGAPRDLAQGHLLKLAQAPDAAQQSQLQPFEYGTVPDGSTRVDIGWLRQQWNIIKQPSWSDLLDDPDLSGKLLEELTAVLGDRAALFLEQQGTANAKQVLQVAVWGWSVSFESLTSTITIPASAPGAPIVTVTIAGPPYELDLTAGARTIKINTSRSDGSGGIISATDSEMNAALMAAISDKKVTEGATGFTGFDSVAAAAADGFVSHPNAGNTLRLGTAVLQIVGGVGAVGAGTVLIVLPTGASQVIGAITIGAGSYTAVSGVDEAIAAIQGLMSGELSVRSIRAYSLDTVTGSQQTTDNILFRTDIGAGIGSLGGCAAFSWMKARNVIAPNGTPVFRVQGGVLPNASKVRFGFDDAGQIIIHGDDMLFINVNQEKRALEFLATRGNGARLVRLELQPKFVEKLRSLAVPQRVGRQFPGRPQLVDPTRAADQFGIPSNLFDELLENIVPGSGSGL